MSCRISPQLLSVMSRLSTIGDSGVITGVGSAVGFLCSVQDARRIRKLLKRAAILNQRLLKETMFKSKGIFRNVG